MKYNKKHEKEMYNKYFKYGKWPKTFAEFAGYPPQENYLIDCYATEKQLDEMLTDLLNQEGLELLMYKEVKGCLLKYRFFLNFREPIYLELPYGGMFIHTNEYIDKFETIKMMFEEKLCKEEDKFIITYNTCNLFIYIRNGNKMELIKKRIL